MKKILIAALLLCLLTACAGENGGKSTDPTGSARLPATGGTADPTPSAGAISPDAPSPTDAPEEVVASVPQCTIFVFEKYFMALREDGTVALLGEPGENSDFYEEYSERVRKWTDIVSLCESNEVPAAITKEGRIVVAAAESFEEEREQYMQEADSWVGLEIAATLEYLKDADPVVWAKVNYPYNCITIDSEGTLVESRNGKLDVVRGASVVAADYDYFLDCYGKLHFRKSDGTSEVLEEESRFVSIAGYPVRTDGTVRTGSYITAIQNWTGLASICESRDGGLYVGLKRNGTVVACAGGVSEDPYGNYAVEEWRDVVEVTTNGYYTVGKTSDGRLLCTEIPPEAGVSFTKEDVEALLQK
ncbi:MAG: hypothetical protein Q4C48_00565 [Lachnospiraceae bacterium]|nr:hypothetical protein [Lachnospiraceae bacterium]